MAFSPAFDPIFPDRRILLSMGVEPFTADSFEGVLEFSNPEGISGGGASPGRICILPLSGLETELEDFPGMGEGEVMPGGNFGSTSVVRRTLADAHVSIMVRNSARFCEGMDSNARPMSSPSITSCRLRMTARLENCCSDSASLKSIVR